MRRLVPDPAATTLEQEAEALRPWESPPEGRPHVFSNFAVTLDGRASIGGRSGLIGSDVDSRLLHLLRARADAIMIGAGTMTAECYGRLVPDAELRAMRERDGLAPDPLAVIVTATLHLPWGAGLFTSGEGEVMIFTTALTTPPATETPVHIVRHDEVVDLRVAMSHLRRECGVRALLTEGGPILHAGLLDEELLDEIFVTIAPKIAGDEGAPTMVEGPLDRVEELELLTLLEHEGELFARYRVN